MNSIRLPHKRGSHKTLWIGLIGTIVVIVGSILFGYAQGQKKENSHLGHLFEDGPAPTGSGLDWKS